MKALLFSSLLLILFASCSRVSFPGPSNRATNKKILSIDPDLGKQEVPALTGQLSKTELMNSTDAGLAWFKKGYNSYEPDQEAVNFLKGISSHIKVIAFAGTWCDDTHRELPHFYKVMDAAGIPEKSISVYGVDREKKSTAIETKSYSIKKVPTFIIYYDGIEKGRVVVFPAITLERDLVKMLK